MEAELTGMIGARKKKAASAAIARTRTTVRRCPLVGAAVFFICSAPADPFFHVNP